MYAPGVVGDNQIAVPPVNPNVFRLLTNPNVVTNPSPNDGIGSVTIPNVVTE